MKQFNIHRYYRPVQDEDTSKEKLTRKRKGDKGYTDDYTIV